jgi:hypothetical protein
MINRSFACTDLGTKHTIPLPKRLDIFIFLVIFVPHVLFPLPYLLYLAPQGGGLGLEAV